jgi:hypothetical protein
MIRLPVVSLTIAGLIGLCCAAPSIAAPEQGPAVTAVSKWSVRGVFGFGSLTFDFLYQRWGEGRLGGAIVDCSDSALFCMSSDRFRVSVPRDCAIARKAEVGTVWALAGVNTAVYWGSSASLAPLHGNGRSPATYYVGDPEVPNVVFEYDPAVGIVRILKDEPGGTDFADLARRGEMEKWLRGYAYDPAKASKVYNMSTFDRFGACDDTRA